MANGGANGTAKSARKGSTSAGAPDLRTLKIDVPLGGGWRASEAVVYVPGSFLVQVALTRRDDVVYVRYDLGKGIFIDPAPVTLTPRQSEHLVDAIQPEAA